jgi:hypothetical protein
MIVLIMSHREVYEWAEGFKSTRTSVSDKDQLRHPSTLHTQDHTDCATALIQEDQLITVSHVAEMLDTCVSVYATLHNDLQHRKVCARWVPRQLTDPHK